MAVTKRPLNVGLIGLGTVGSQVADRMLSWGPQLSRRAGALPIPEQTLLAQISELLAKRNIEVTPYRHEGHLVALLRFQAENARPLAQLTGREPTASP